MVDFVYPNEMETQWGILIVLYPYLTGLVAGAFLVSALYHVFGIKKLEPVAKLSLIISLTLLLVSPLPLLIHLGRPERALEILFTPNFNSAMAGFGYIYFFYLLLLISEIWLIFRQDIVRNAQEGHGIRRRINKLLSLRTSDLDEKQIENDKKIVKVLSIIGVPSAMLLHAYVGFIFGAIKANPWWSTPLMPVIFLLSSITSGLALLFLVFTLTSWIRKQGIDTESARSMLKWLFGFAILTISIEILELFSTIYEAGESWEIISTLLMERISFSYFGIQMILGSIIPIALLGFIGILRIKDNFRIITGILASSLILIGVFAMRWNIVVGGQLISRSLRGFLEYYPTILGKEGLIVASSLMILPFLIFVMITFIIPPWEAKKKQILDKVDVEK
jgi:predicted membrane protein